jgi:hypothetical protein
LYNVNGVGVYDYYKSDYSGWDPVKLQGSLALMDEDDIYIENNWISNNVYVNATKVSTYLRHLFYYD